MAKYVSAAISDSRSGSSANYDFSKATRFSVVCNRTAIRLFIRQTHSGINNLTILLLPTWIFPDTAFRTMIPKCCAATR
jgi:hypothetical protein